VRHAASVEMGSRLSSLKTGFRRALEPSGYGTHSMRRTKVAKIYRKTGNQRAVQLLLGYTKVDSTVRYLGVELEDVLSISERLDI
jgi:site-specific recombinase XerC